MSPAFPARMVAILVTWVLCVPPPSAAAQEAQPDASRFEFRTNPLLGLHMYLRAAAGREEAVQLDGAAEAMDALRRVEEALGGPSAWGMVEPIIASSADAPTLQGFVQRLPVSSRLRDGREIALREPMTAYARALAVVEPAFRKDIWPAHEQAIERAPQRLSATFKGREADCIRHLQDALGMRDPGVVVPVYLVAEAPAPAAFTHRGRGGPICIVGVDEADDGLLAEMVLHELIHALDVTTADQPATALNRLRAALVDAGVQPSDGAHRDLPHTLMFAQAAATVRELLDPGHQAYGEARGYYAKLPEAFAAVAPAWSDRVAGRLDVEQAVTRIVAAATGARGAARPPMVFVFPYFLDNGQDGIYLALSRDGVNFMAANEGRPILDAPLWEGEWLTRDPSIIHHDGMFHMVWTTGWWTRSIGYASSKNLVTWSEPRKIDIWREAKGVKNTWAPELHWDPQEREFFILFSSTLENELEDGDGSTDPHGHDHRIYVVRTTDFESFTAPERFYAPEPEHGVIDAHVSFDDRGTADEGDDRWVMVIKNEMGPEAGGKNLRLAFARQAQGPYGPLGEPIGGQGTPIMDRMAEGPALLRADGLWWLYWDAPGADVDYCLATSPDLVTWTDRSAEVRMPVPDPRHGTVLRVPISAVGWLDASAVTD